MVDSADSIEALLHRLRAELPEQISAAVARLEDAVRHFDPLDLIASETVYELFRDLQNQEEGQQAHVEYLATICLTYAYWKSDRDVFSADAFNEVIGLVAQICHDTMWYYAAEIVEPQAVVLPALHRLRVRSIVNELYVRNPAYYHHVEDLLTRLLSEEPTQSWMQSALGFGPNDFFRCVHSVVVLLNKRFEEQRVRARERERDLLAELASCQQRGVAPSWLPAGVTTPEDVACVVRTQCAVDLSRGLGEALSFTPAELSAEANLSLDKAATILDAFSIDFGSVPAQFRRPAVAGPLHARPFIRHRGKYMCPVPALVPWALRPYVEGALNPDRPGALGTSQKLWDSYQKARGRFLITEALAYFKAALPSAECYESLRYEVLVDGESVSCDLDGLVIFDGSFFLIEGKAGGFRASARRGGVNSLAADLNQLLEEPYRQALRARDYILGCQKPYFTLRNGALLELDASRIKRTIPTTLTLEPLDTFVANLEAVRQAGIGVAPEPHWAIQLFDLRVICELLEWPSQLIHYLFRRLRLNESEAFHAHDELDWFAQYLRGGLYFDELISRGEYSGISVMGTKEIDDYYFSQSGQGTASFAKPRQPMPDAIRELLDELSRRRAERHSEVMLLLLDCGAETKKSIATQLERIRRETQQDGSSHNASVAWTDHLGPVGVTLVSYTTNEVSPRELMLRLQQFVEIKKYQAKASRWVGLATLANVSGLIHAWILADGEWESDPLMDARLNQWLRLQDREAADGS